MKKEVADKIKKALVQHRGHRQQVDQEKKKRHQQEHEFLARFIKVRKDIIKPAIEEIGVILRNEGYQYNISMPDEGEDPSGRSVPASITMTILDPERKGGFQQPFFSARCDKIGGKVQFSESTIGSEYAALADSGETTIEGLTKDMIHDRIAALISAIFTPKPT
jgi:hypothetical protein